MAALVSSATSCSYQKAIAAGFVPEVFDRKEIQRGIACLRAQGARPRQKQSRRGRPRLWTGRMGRSRHLRRCTSTWECHVLASPMGLNSRWSSNPPPMAAQAFSGSRTCAHFCLFPETFQESSMAPDTDQNKSRHPMRPATHLVSDHCTVFLCRNRLCARVHCTQCTWSCTGLRGTSKEAPYGTTE